MILRLAGGRVWLALSIALLLIMLDVVWGGSGGCEKIV